MPLVPVTPSPVQVEVEGVEQAIAFADGTVKKERLEIIREVIKVRERKLAKFCPDLPM
jgi:hypothetical protein